MDSAFVELFTACTVTSFALGVAFVVQCSGKKKGTPPPPATGPPGAQPPAASTAGPTPSAAPAPSVAPSKAADKDKPTSHRSQQSKPPGAAESKANEPDAQTQPSKVPEKKPDEKPDEKPKEGEEPKKSEKDKEPEKKPDEEAKPDADAKPEEEKPTPGAASKKASSTKDKPMSLQETQKSIGSKKDTPKESKKETPKESKKETPKEEPKKEEPKKEEPAAGKEQPSIEGVVNVVPTEFKLDPPELKFTDKGGILKIKVLNESKDRRAIKIRCSDNALYRVNPVFLFLEPGKNVEVEVVRQAGKPKQDKLVFVVVKAPADAKEFPPLFAKVVKGETPMLPVPLKAA